MRDKLSTSFLIFLFGLFFSFFSSLAQAKDHPGLPSQTWRCLKLEKYQGEVKPEGVNHHRVALSAEGLPANKDIYIVGCVATADSLKCTTGNNDYDQKLGFGKDNYTSLQNSTTPPLPYNLIVDGGSRKKTSSDGKLEKTIAASWTKGVTEHSFYGVLINEPEMLPGTAKSLQYGTFEFNQDAAKCTTVKWDPYGRVFDSQSLEPISGVSIAILDTNKNQVLIPGNPQTTQVDGAFNFLVEPGDYLLSPAVPSGYSFSNNPNLHPNYIKAYFDIYKPGEIITEKAGYPEHRDIPLDPTGRPPFHSNPTMITYGDLRLGNKTKFEGKISHPLSTVSLMTETTKQEIGKTSADKFGFWEIVLNAKEIPQEEEVIANITKVDLTANQTQSFLPRLFFKLFKKVFAQNLQTAKKRVVFHPIFNHLEGYAYDEKNNPIANALVKVKLKMSDSVYYQTTADSQGYFVIPKENLPIFEYYLEFQSQGKKPVQKTTDQFAQNNRQYLAANRINLMTATKNNTPIVLPRKTTTSTTEAESPVSLPTNTTNPSPAENPNAKKTQNLLLPILFLLLIITTAGGILFYLKKKKESKNLNNL